MKGKENVAQRGKSLGVPAGLAVAQEEEAVGERSGNIVEAVRRRRG